MVEIKEVLRLWRAGRQEEADRRPADAGRQDRAPLRRCRARAAGSRPAPETLERRAGRRRRRRARARDAADRTAMAGQRCVAERDEIERLLGAARAALEGAAAAAPARASTSRTRRCTASRSRELGFGQRATDDPRRRRRARRGDADRHRLDDAARARRARARRRFRAWIFTPCAVALPLRLSVLRGDDRERDRGVRGGVGVLRRRVPRRHARQHEGDRAHRRSARKPRIIDGFLEYAQARGFHVDPARPRHPKDKARTSAAVRDVRDDCFAGEKLLDLDDAAPRADWCARRVRHAPSHDARSGCRASTSRPRRSAHLLAGADGAVRHRRSGASPRSRADQHAQVARCAVLAAVRVRAASSCALAPIARPFASTTVSRALIKTHPRVAPGGRSTDSADFPRREGHLRDARRRGARRSRAQPRRRRSASSPHALLDARCRGRACAALHAARPRQALRRAPRRRRPAPSRVAADMLDVFRARANAQARALRRRRQPEPARVIPLGSLSAARH